MPHPSSHICFHCLESYLSSAPNSKYCSKRECQQAKARKWLSNRSTFNKQRRAEYKSQGLKLKFYDNPCQFETSPGKICGDKTGVNRNLCPYHLHMVDDTGMQVGCSI